MCLAQGHYAVMSVRIEPTALGLSQALNHRVPFTYMSVFLSVTNICWVLIKIVSLRCNNLGLKYGQDNNHHFMHINLFVLLTYVWVTALNT